jgi:hypothetical protein
MGTALWLLLFVAVGALQVLAYRPADRVTPRDHREVVATGRDPYCISQPAYYLVLEGGQVEGELRRIELLQEGSRLRTTEIF